VTQNQNYQKTKGQIANKFQIPMTNLKRVQGVKDSEDKEIGL
jgi:hypothetical protein